MGNCKICGAKLKKEGDICRNCYKMYKEDEEFKNDKDVQLVVKRSYSISRVVQSYIVMFVILIICAVFFFIAKRILEGFIVIGLFILALAVLLFIDKWQAKGTKAVFYKKRVVYCHDFLFFSKRKEVRYNDIDDILIAQKRGQKKEGSGDLLIYAKGNVIPLKTLLSGFEIKNVENVEEVFNKILDVIGIEFEDEE